MQHAVQETPERSAFYRAIDGENLSALWNNMAALDHAGAAFPLCAISVAFRCHPFARMLEAGALITAKEAERRVLVLENPGLRGQSKITTSLYAGVQLVLPGEVAPAHRHTQSALRFVLEGKGAHTAVGGEKTMMAPGDFVITPAMNWHDHGNASSDPMFWLDGLDIPVVQFLDASFAEGLDEDEQPITRKTGDSLARFGRNLMPVGTVRKSKTSPIFNYPYSETRPALDAMKRQDEVGRVPRSQVALHESGVRRLRHADDGHVHSAAAEGFLDRAIPLDGCDGLHCRRRFWPQQDWAMKSSNGVRAMSLSCRAGNG